MRAFNHHLLTECRALAESADYDSFVLQRTPGSSQPFAIRDGVRLYLYASEAPCTSSPNPTTVDLWGFLCITDLTNPGGDASMELTMSAQEDPTPWTAPPPSSLSRDPDTPTLPGREDFSQLGIVRRKPSRPDAPLSLSKSCSDKLALRQATSLLSSLTSLLVTSRGAYLSGLVVPGSAYVSAAFERCFARRMAPLKDSMAHGDGGYEFRGMEPLTTDLAFDFSRGDGKDVAPCNVSAVWTPTLDEGLVGGVLQGKKAFTDRGASGVSRRRMWGLARDAADLLSRDDDELGSSIYEALAVGRYGDMKEGRLLEDRRRAKVVAREGALRGWVRNTGDEDFGLEAS